MPAHQATLLGGAEPALSPSPRFDRFALDDRSWIDVSREWLLGADTLLDDLVECVDWKQGRRKMWDRVLDDPRLSRWYAPGASPPHPVLTPIGDALEARYDVALTGPGLNYYRDGNDSVAPHADRELRVLDDTLICILTLGARRPFLVKPKSGGRSYDVAPGSGDLLVMGGASQLGYTHGVPKCAHAGPRVSVTWRWANRSHRGTRRRAGATRVQLMSG